MTESIERMLPLYESKMIATYDHRDADVVRSATAQKRQNQPRYLTNEDHADPTRLAFPMYWIDQSHVLKELRGWALAYSAITSPTNLTTFSAAIVPSAATGHSLFVMHSNDAGVLLPMMNSLVFDFIARQKLAGLNLSFYIVEQLPFLSFEQFGRPSPWGADTSIRAWLSLRTIELTYTAYDVHSFSLTYSGSLLPPFIWDPERRFLLRLEIDASFFHLYGLGRSEVEHILDQFPKIRARDESAFAEYRTKRVVLEIFDAMQIAIDSGVPYQTILDPPPGEGHRHPAKDAS